MIKQFKCKIYWVEVGYRTCSPPNVVCLWSGAKNDCVCTTRQDALDCLAGSLEHVQTIAEKLARNECLLGEYSTEQNPYHDNLLLSWAHPMQKEAADYHEPLFESLRDAIRAEEETKCEWLDHTVFIDSCFANVCERMEKQRRNPVR